MEHGRSRAQAQIAKAVEAAHSPFLVQKLRSREGAAGVLVQAAHSGRRLLLVASALRQPVIFRVEVALDHIDAATDVSEDGLRCGNESCSRDSQHGDSFNGLIACTRLYWSLWKRSELAWSAREKFLHSTMKIVTFHAAPSWRYTS
jgi:hypothetical protein